MSDFIDFYRGEVVHPNGYTLDKILKSDDHWLEVTHDYIQWLFPSKKASASVPDSPVISQAEIDAFKTQKDLKQGLSKSYKRMLEFYGFEISTGSGESPIVVRANNFQERQKFWLSPNNHNFKRITRIIESLVLLGQQEAADQFYSVLSDLDDDYSSQIGLTTFSFWKNAVAGRATS